MGSCRPCQGWRVFCQSRQTDESCPVKVKPDYVSVPVDGTKFNCQGAFYKRKAKNAANCAKASSPIDIVSAAGSVKVPKV